MLNKIIIFLVIIVLVTLAGSAFYWFELRLIPIKKECSWVTDTRIAVLGDLGMTQEQADRENVKTNERFPNGCNGVDPDSIEALVCDRVATARPPREQKMTSYVRSATSEEYKECLRHNGLD